MINDNKRVSDKPRRVTHVKRGTTYDVIGEAEMQIAKPTGYTDRDKGYRFIMEGDNLTIYKGEDGKLWARFPDEFNDGRFKENNDGHTR